MRGLFRIVREITVSLSPFAAQTDGLASRMPSGCGVSTVSSLALQASIRSVVLFPVAAFKAGVHPVEAIATVDSLGLVSLSCEYPAIHEHLYVRE